MDIVFNTKMWFYNYHSIFYSIDFFVLRAECREQNSKRLENSIDLVLCSLIVCWTGGLDYD